MVGLEMAQKGAQKGDQNHNGFHIQYLVGLMFYRIILPSSVHVGCKT
jgi:hypothetical protein